jgi:selenocysteine lyase/cysteine desulfurase
MIFRRFWTKRASRCGQGITARNRSWITSPSAPPVRASFAMYNTKAEVDALVEGLEFCHELFG